MRCDVGLVQIRAHKLVLSSASPVFHDLLKNNPHPSPLIYMRGIKTEELQAIVDFVYCGQASVDRKDLTAFLALAEELQLKGLTDHSQKNQKLHGCEEAVEQIQKYRSKKSAPGEDEIRKHGVGTIQTDNERKTFGRIDNNRDNEMLKTQFEPFLDCEEESPPSKSPSTMEAVENFHDQIELTKTRLSPSSIDGEIFHQQIEVMMSRKSDTFLYDSKKVAWTCNLCGKQGTQGQIKRHIEAKHITGVRHKCDLCHKTSKSRYALKVHKKRNHDF